MRIVLKVLGWLAAVLILVPVFAVLAAILLLNIDPGRRLAERLAGQLTAGQVEISGLSGRFPDALRLAHAELRDNKGAWLTIDDVALDWSPLALLHREAQVDLLQAGLIRLPRLPQPSTTPPPTPANDAPFSLPVRVSVDALHIQRAEIGAAVAGVAGVLALDGTAHLASLQDGDADVTIDRLDSPGAYHVQGRIDPASLSAAVHIAEPPQGLIAEVAKLPDIGAIRLDAAVTGPRTAEAATLHLTAGPLTADAKGTVDIERQTADVDVSASAPAMTPAPGITWQSVALDAHVHGPFTTPDATGQLRLAGLSAGGASVQMLTASVAGNQGAVQVKAAADGLRIPGPKPDLLAAAPLTVQADARLDSATLPVTFALAHPLLQANGTAQIGGAIKAHAVLTAPDLRPLAGLAGMDLQGRTALTVDAGQDGSAMTVTLDGSVGITGGMGVVPALLGDDASIGITAALAGSDVTVSRATIAGRTLHLDAAGSDKADTLDLRYTVGLTDLAAVAPAVDGAVQLTGTARGPLTDLTVDASLAGDAGTKGFPKGPIKLAVNATGLPSKTAGSVTASALLDGAPLTLAATAQRGADGTLHADISKAEWKSLHAGGAFTLPLGAALPEGKLALQMTRLDDLRPLAGQAISGSIIATAALDHGLATLDLRAEHAGIPGSSVGSAVLAARVTDPAANPAVTATLSAEGIEAGVIGGSARLAVNGPQTALGIKLNANLTNLAGADAVLAAAALLDVPAKTVQLGALTADWKGQAVRLLGPARVSFGDGVAVDRLRIGFQTAVLELAGRAAPKLDLTASLRGVTPDLAKPFAPDLDAAGQISADAKLTGTPAAPQGTLHLTASGLRMRTGPARGIPAANLTATVQLQGTDANVDARLTAGSANLAVTGRAPLRAGALALRADGALDLAMLDPILAAQGRRARGRITIAAGVTGTAAAPLATGDIRLAGGEVQDFGQGLRIYDISADIQGSGQAIRIAKFTGRAGGGTISASGSVGLQAPMPVDLALTMRHATPLASDLLTADLDADLAVRGAVDGALAATGRLGIQHAAINVPEHLPASVAVLPVRIAGAPPAPPSKPGPTIGLDLQLDTPGQIFVRGRGLDAVLGGSLHVGGTTAAPQVNGAFKMVRGTFSLAGTTLNFTRGAVGFDGAGVANRIDPSLDFRADAPTTTGTASLLVGGYASAPEITLTSVPPQPQDQILALLLFGQSATSLSPFQYAEIAAALAQLAGTGGGSPLDSVRKGLGLDRLSVGGATNANGTSNTSAATIEAGKYVANGVYVGAKQGTSGTQTQAVVQIDIYKGLKAETDVGASGSGSTVGLSYSFDY